MRQIYDMFEDFNRVFVGFDRLFNQMAPALQQAQKMTYPPFNVRKKGDNTYILEMAVAGFGKQDIEIVLEDGVLTIRGKHTSDTDDGSLLYRGIANRMFTRTFAISDDIQVKGANLINGMLRVFLERLVPEHKKPKRIEITDDEPQTVGYTHYNSDRKLLTEDEIEQTRDKLVESEH